MRVSQVFRGRALSCKNGKPNEKKFMQDRRRVKNELDGLKQRKFVCACVCEGPLRNDRLGDVQNGRRKGYKYKTAS